MGSDGTTALGNGRNGILLDQTLNNSVGGTVPGAGNIIANSIGISPTAPTGNGAAIYSATDPGRLNPILGNSIFDNFAEGIALVNNGNELQPKPVLTFASQGSSTSLALSQPQQILRIVLKSF